MRRYRLLFPIFSFLFFTSINAQFSEVGIGYGTLFYSGDLTESGPKIKESRFAGSCFYRYNFNNRFAVRFQYTFGEVRAFDRNNVNETLTNRNLSFRSKIHEVSLQVEVEILKLFSGNLEQKSLSPYLFVGIGGFRFNPQARLGNVWYDLQPLGTEGQGLDDYPNRKPYNLTSIHIPFGVSLKTLISRRTFIGFELGARKLFTDYLDDVSSTYVENDLLRQTHGELAARLADRTTEFDSSDHRPAGSKRGNANNKDWYGVAQIYLTYNFISKEKWRKMKNPSFYK